MSLKVSCRGTLWALLLGLLFLHSTQGASAPMDFVDAEEAADGALDASLEMDLNMEQEIEDTGRKRGGSKKEGSKKKGLGKKKVWSIRKDTNVKCGKGCGKNCRKKTLLLRLIKNELLDRECLATPKLVNGIRAMVRFNESAKANHPKWILQNNCFDENGYVWWKKRAGNITECKNSANGGKPVSIQCPCNSAHGGSKLSEFEAYQQILAQVSTVPIPGASLLPTPAQKLSITFDRLRSAMATSMMVKCWKSRCASELSEQNLQLGSGNEWGGGVAC